MALTISRPEGYLPFYERYLPQVMQGVSKVQNSKAANIAGKVLKPAKPLLKVLGPYGNYLTGQTLGKDIGTIIGADDPEHMGTVAGLSYASMFPLTGGLGLAFDTGYGIGEMLDDMTGASKFWGNWLSETDPFSLNAKSHDYTQDRDWQIARNRYLQNRAKQAQAQSIWDRVLNYSKEI